MITVKIGGESEEVLISAAKKRGVTVDKLISDVINKYLPLLHTIDKDGMAKGYEDMGEINVDISEGNAD